MKNLFLSCLLALLPLMSIAQLKFRPVLDSSATCSWYKASARMHIQNPLYEEENKLEIFYILDNMPEPLKGFDEMEDVLTEKVIMNEEEKKLQAEIYLQCIINCKGESGDFQLISCPVGFENVACQVMNLIREELKIWVPGSLGDTPVDTLVKLLVKTDQSEFKLVGPVY